MGVATGCGCKEVYRFPHTAYPYSTCICSFLQQLKAQRRIMPNRVFLLRAVRIYVNCGIIAMLFAVSIGNQPCVEHDYGV